MRYECNKLFVDQLTALGKHLGKDPGYLKYKYVGTDAVQDVYVVYFNYDSRCMVADAIVFWSGWRINYQSINRPGLFIYEPEKSLKDECLELVDGAYKCADEMLISSYGREERMKIKGYLSDLRTALNKIEDNT